MMVSDVRYSLALFFQECIIETLSENEIDGHAENIAKIDLLVVEYSKNLSIFFREIY